jgi:hypothetical protein
MPKKIRQYSNNILTTMSLLEYQDNGPVPIPLQLNLHKLMGKSVIITGGKSENKAAFFLSISKQTQ